MIFICINFLSQCSHHLSNLEQSEARFLFYSKSIVLIKPLCAQTRYAYLRHTSIQGAARSSRNVTAGRLPSAHI